MSKRLIAYVVALIGIVVFMVHGVPYLQGTPEQSDSHVHVIEGVMTEEIKPEEIGNFQSVSLSDLTESEKQFFDQMNVDKGVYQIDDLVFLSLGSEREQKESIKFSRQEVRSDQVRIYVKIKPEQTTEESNHVPSVLIGKMKVPTSVTLSFIDEETGNLLY